MSANYVLVLVNRLAGAFHCPVASKTARRSGNRPALCRLGVRPGQRRRERLGDLLMAGVVGMQTIGPTNQIPDQADPPDQADHGLCRVKGAKPVTSTCRWSRASARAAKP